QVAQVARYVLTAPLIVDVLADLPHLTVGNLDARNRVVQAQCSHVGDVPIDHAARATEIDVGEEDDATVELRLSRGRPRERDRGGKHRAPTRNAIEYLFAHISCPQP